MSLRPSALVLLGLCCLAGCPISPRGFDTQGLLWPDGAPGARGTRRHDQPRLFFYPAESNAPTGTAVVIASGGSYGHHGGIAVEATPTAKWLAKQGITAVVVRYRLGERGGYDHRAFLADGARAIQLVRSRARALHIDPHRIGVLGYSAGGHLAASLAMRCPASDAPSPTAPIELPADALASVSCRPDFAVSVYPVVTLQRPYAHERSRDNLLGGEQDPPDALLDALSLERQATSTAAPMFIVHSNRDTNVVVENAQLLYDALIREGASAQLRRYDDGGHGVGLAQHSRRMPQMSTWTADMLAWLDELGMLQPRGP